MEPPIATEVEPEIQMGMEAAEQRKVETQAQPVQVFPKEELVANLNPVPGMPTAEQFLAEWVNVATGGTSTPEFITAVTPLTVTAGTMQQLMETPGVQITMILVTIPLSTTEPTMVVDTDPKEHDTKEVTAASRLATSVTKGIASTAPSTSGVAVESSGVTTDTPATLQGELWKEGQEESERVMELELDQGGESQNESQAEEDVQEKRGGGETTSKSSKEEEQRKEDARSTLTSEPKSDEEQTLQPSSHLLQGCLDQFQCCSTHPSPLEM